MISLRQAKKVLPSHTLINTGEGLWAFKRYTNACKSPNVVLFKNRSIILHSAVEGVGKDTVLATMRGGVAQVSKQMYNYFKEEDIMQILEDFTSYFELEEVISVG